MISALPRSGVIRFASSGPVRRPTRRTYPSLLTAFGASSGAQGTGPVGVTSNGPGSSGPVSVVTAIPASRGLVDRGTITRGGPAGGGAGLSRHTRTRSACQWSGANMSSS